MSQASSVMRDLSTGGLSRASSVGKVSEVQVVVAFGDPRNEGSRVAVQVSGETGNASAHFEEPSSVGVSPMVCGTGRGGPHAGRAARRAAADRCRGWPRDPLLTVRPPAGAADERQMGVEHEEEGADHARTVEDARLRGPRRPPDAPRRVPRFVRAPHAHRRPPAGGAHRSNGRRPSSPEASRSRALP